MKHNSHANSVNKQVHRFNLLTTKPSFLHEAKNLMYSVVNVRKPLIETFFLYCLIFWQANSTFDIFPTLASTVECDFNY